MDSQPSSGDSALKTIRDFAAKELQQEYPYLKTNLIEQMLDKVQTSLQHDLIQAEPAIAECERRINFMTLPREIRDYIYDFALDIRPYSLQYASIHEPRKGWESGGFEGKFEKAWGQISRQVRSEFREAYYGRQEFHISIEHWRYFLADPKTTRLFIERFVKPQAHLFKKLTIQIQTRQGRVDRMMRGIWWYLAEKGYIDYNMHEPSNKPRLNKEMVLLLVPLEEAGVHRSVITTECLELDIELHQIPEAKDRNNIFAEVSQPRRGISNDPLRPVPRRRLTI